MTKTDVVQLVLSRSGVAEGTRDTGFQGKQQEPVSSSASHALYALQRSKRWVAGQTSMTRQHPPVKSCSGLLVSPGSFCLLRSSCVYKMELRLPLQCVNEHHFPQGQAEIKPCIHSPTANICLHLRIFQIWAPVIGKQLCRVDVPHQ